MSKGYFSRKNRVHLKEASFILRLSLVLLVIFLVIPLGVQILAAMRQEHTDGMNSPDNDLKPLTTRTQDGVQSGAKEGIGQGEYQPPTDPWLHEGYAAGVAPWSVEGHYVGVSQDKSVIVFQSLDQMHVSGDQVVVVHGYDVATGKRRWKRHQDPLSDCSTVRDGIAYCVAQSREGMVTLRSIDLAAGHATHIASINEGKDLSYQFLGVHAGRTYWMVTKKTTDDVSGFRKVLAIAGGHIQWEITVQGEDSDNNQVSCVLANGAIGCQIANINTRTLRFDIYNANTGQKATEFTDLDGVRWHSNGFVISSASDPNYIHYSWAGEKKEVYETYRNDIWPGEAESVLFPAEVAQNNPLALMVNAQGKAIVRRFDSDRMLPLTHVPSGKELPPVALNMETRASASGSVFSIRHQPAENEQELLFYSKDATEIARYTVPATAEVTDSHGIIVVKGGKPGKEGQRITTVYAPKG
ncbi:MAG: hypothetical protein Q4C87_01405 [Actinomycetaceae bacterium]|nr:hypothetical protein [Actinomycetaceae bacterium]